MPERLPRPPWPINPIKAPGNLVEIDLRLFAAPIENAFEVDLIARVLRQLIGPANRQLNELLRRSFRLRIESVEGPFPLPSRLHQLRVLQQAEVRGNARLPHPRDLLQFVHRQRSEERRVGKECRSRW